MATSFARRAALVFLLAASAAAQAQDNTDYDLFGPNGRSSLSLELGAGRSEYKGDLFGSGAKERVTNDSAGLSLVYALNRQVSFSATTWHTRLHGGSTGRESTHYEDLGVSAWLVGDIDSPGFKMNGTLNADVGEHADGHYRYELQPQYRFDPQWLVSVQLGQARAGNDVTSYAFTILSWKASPSLNALAIVGFTRPGSTADYDGGNTRSLDLGAVCAFGRQWSAIATVGATRENDSTYPLSGYRTIDSRSYNLFLGVRYTL